MKIKTFLIIAMTSCAISATAQDDLIIYRDGRERSVKIIQVNTDRTLFSTGKRRPEEWVDNSDVYMLKFKERGNVAFNENGERILTEKVARSTPKGAILMYLKNGKELIVFDLGMDAAKIRYKLSNKKNAIVSEIDKSEVFMLKYPDGSRDVLNDITANTATKNATEEASTEQTDDKDTTDEPEEKKPEPLRAAVITTKRGYKMTVYVSKETKTSVAYKKINDSKAPVFTLSRANIRNIRYK